MPLIFEQIRVGGDRNFGYLLGDSEARQAVLVDPSYSPEALAERAAAQGLKVTHILNTHGHDDHTNGNARARELTGAPLAAFTGAASAPQIPLSDSQEIKLGALTLHCLHTPGHCEDHLVFAVTPYDLALTGDLLFVGKVGGTQDPESARTEWNSLQRLIQLLPGKTTVWPGHDYGVRPASTLALEKESNPFLRCQNFNQFLQLKNDWPVYKAQHGLK